MHAFAPTVRDEATRPSESGGDRVALNAVLDAGILAHVGYAVGGRPHVAPTAYWRCGDRLYWHGAALPRPDAVDGVEACVTVTQLDGIVMARSGCRSAIEHRSAMCFGRAQEVRDPAEKARALQAFVERLTPGRWAELRPLQAQELARTPVFAMRIEAARTVLGAGEPQDAAEDCAQPVWAGRVPVRLTAGEPVPDAKLGPAIMLPDSVAGMVAALKHPPKPPTGGVS